MTELAGWQNFYVIVGSSAGALIGLQFVVLTLIADMPITGSAVGQAGAVFSTPTIVHFGTVLLLAALQNAPWHALTVWAAVWIVVGLCGVVYCLLIAGRMRGQQIYQPVFEDWVFHVILPTSAYALLALAAYAAMSYLREALFGIAASALVLLFAGIHNAWDTVTYHVFNRRPPEPTSAKRSDFAGDE